MRDDLYAAFRSFRSAPAFTAVAVVATVAAYPLAHRRCMKNVIDGHGGRAPWWSSAASRLWLRLLTPLLRGPLERGLAGFIISTLTRNHPHRFLIGSYVAVGVLLALPLVGRLAGPTDQSAVQYAWFSVPLGLLCWTTAALRIAVILPVEPASNWIFKLTEPVDKRRVLSITVTVIQGATAISLGTLFGIASGIFGGLALGVAVFAVVLGTGIVLIEALTLTRHTVPCTCNIALDNCGFGCCGPSI